MLDLLLVFCGNIKAAGFAQQSQEERAWWRWHSRTRRSPRRPPIMTKPNGHRHGLMRGPRRHRSRERTRTGSIDTRQTRIEAQLHRKRMKGALALWHHTFAAPPSKIKPMRSKLRFLVKKSRAPWPCGIIPSPHRRAKSNPCVVSCASW